MTQEEQRIEWRLATARYRERHRDRVRARHRREMAAWRSLNPELRNARHRQCMRRRRLKDPGFRALSSLRSRLVIAVRNSATTKASTTLKLLGCTPDFLLTYIEARFTDGMTWENYGLGKNKWHIDHIIPCCSFDLTKPEQQRQCFHYSNLRPMWGVENFRKGSKCPAVHQKELL